MRNCSPNRWKKIKIITVCFHYHRTFLSLQTNIECKVVCIIHIFQFMTEQSDSKCLFTRVATPVCAGLRRHYMHFTLCLTVWACEALIESCWERKNSSSSTTSPQRTKVTGGWESRTQGFDCVAPRWLHDWCVWGNGPWHPSSRCSPLGRLNFPLWHKIVPLQNKPLVCGFPTRPTHNYILADIRHRKWKWEWIHKSKVWEEKKVVFSPRKQ